jgi:hypothetical protein
VFDIEQTRAAAIGTTTAMRSNRLLFTDSPARGSLLPIYAAILLLVALGVIGLIVAYWPTDSEPNSVRRTSEATQPRTPLSEGGLRVPPAGRAPRSRMKAM